METLFSEYSAHYFFSTLLQADAAIIAVWVVFVVFRFQMLRRRIDDIKSYLFRLSSSITPTAIQEFENKDLMEKASYLESNHIKLNDGYIWSWFNEWFFIECDIKYFKEKANKIFFGFTPLLFFISVLLLFASFIHSLGALIEGAVSMVALIFNIYIVYGIIKVAREIINPKD